MSTKPDSSQIKHETGTLKDIADASKPLADYTALRAYTGTATTVRITSTGIAGIFTRDSDVVTADNGGTVIVDASGRRWKRVFDGAVNVRWFGATGGTDDTAAIQAAVDYTASIGGATVSAVGVYKASQIILKRFVVIDGGDAGTSELQQIGGSNVDFITSENFASLTGTGLTVGGSALVPSFFGLKNIRVNGNRKLTTNLGGNTSGRGLAWYGPALITEGTVIVYGCAGDGVYTEYSDTLGSSGWQGQEEGQFGAVVVRDNGGSGWRFRGPHNSKISSVLAGYNGDWGFINESGVNYDGGLDQVGLIHTYANGRTYTPATGAIDVVGLDTGVSIGEICRIDTLMTDGDNPTISASNCQVGKYRGYNLGGARDGLVISGNANIIGNVNASVWSSSVGRQIISVTGTRNQILGGDLAAVSSDNNGVLISGNQNKVDLHVEGFTATGRSGVNLTGSYCRVLGSLSNNKIGLSYTAGSNNKVDLEIVTTSGQLAVSGSTPALTDRFSIRASGAGQAGGTRTSVQTAQFPLDVTTSQAITIAHGLLYTPTRSNVALTLLESSPSTLTHQVAFMRVNSVDATNVVIGFRLAVAGDAGALARIGVRSTITE